MINWKAVKEKNLKLLILDAFMIFVALINILLISFDYTYLSFRNFYYHNFPELTETYDQLKGIEPHRFTENYIRVAQNYFDSFKIETYGDPELKNEIISLSKQMIDEDPFSRANKSGDLEVIKDRIRSFTNNESSKDGFTEFWDISPVNIIKRYNFYREDIKPLLETNYWRHIDKKGNYVDNFFYIDLIFIIIFLTEFFIMWIYSIRTKGNDEKILYPLYHWYDIVSCIPLKEFRFLRLLRFLSVYFRLLRSDILTIGEGPVVRIIQKYLDIINEEISAQVSLNIYNDIQEKLRLGINRTIIEDTIQPYKETIIKVVIDNIKQMELRIVNENHNHLVNFSSEIIQDSIQATPQYQQFMKIPYVSTQLEKLTNKKNISGLVDQSLKNLQVSLNENLNSEVGNELLYNIVEDIIDEIIVIMRDQTIQQLVEDINYQFVEELKKGAKVRKWQVRQKSRMLNEAEPVTQINPDLLK